MSDDVRQFDVPDEIELLQFFGVEPAERSVEDGYWCYEVADERGVRLRLSFNMLERSVQTALSLGSTPLAMVSHEGAVRLHVDAATLRCEFISREWMTALALVVRPTIELEWSTLRTR